MLQMMAETIQPFAVAPEDIALEAHVARRKDVLRDVDH